MKWSKLTGAVLLVTAQACAGDDAGSDMKDLSSSGANGLDESGSTGDSPSETGGRSNAAAGSSSSKAGSTSSSADESSAGVGGKSSSGGAGGKSSSAGAGGKASGGAGGKSSSAGAGGSSGSNGGGSSGSSGVGTCTAGAATPCVRQALEWAAGDDNGKKGVLTFKQPVLASSTVVAFAADMNINRSSPDAPIGSGTPDPITMIDSGNGTYQELLTVLDDRDWDDVKVFARSNVPAGSLTVTAGWVTNQWHALMIVEVANVSATPSIAVAGILNPGAEETKDAASSGPLNLKASPALVVGLGVNFTDKKGDEGAPFAGTGFTAILQAWNWNGKEGTTTLPSALLESAYFPSPGKVAATFTPSKTINYKDNIMAIAVGIQ